MKAMTEGRKKHTCSVCQKLCKTSYGLEVHFRLHTGERPYKCDVCGTSFKSKGNLNEHHAIVHSDERPFSCVICATSVKTMHALEGHLLFHTKEKPYFCLKCHGSCSTQSDLKKHVVARHGGKNGKKCGKCPKQFYSLTELKAHMRVHTRENPFSCSICGNRFTQNSSLKLHALIHSGEMPWTCLDCPKKFAQKGQLSVHVRHVHSIERPFPCEICGKDFASKGDRDKHLNEKPYKCPKCGKRFCLAKGLRYHLKVHDAVRNVKCSKCDRVFLDQAHLKLHYLRIHAEPRERQFICIFCAKTLTTKADLEFHLRGHIGERPHFCTRCPTSWPSVGNLNRHIKSVHI